MKEYEAPRKDPSGKSWTKIAYNIGIPVHIIHHYKCVYPEHMKFIYTYDVFFEEAYKKYIIDAENTKIRLREIYYELSASRNIFKFSKFLCEKKVYGHPHSFSTAAGGPTFFSQRTRVTPKHLIRFKEIIKEYEKFKVKDVIIRNEKEKHNAPKRR